MKRYFLIMLLVFTGCTSENLNYTFNENAFVVSATLHSRAITYDNIDTTSLRVVPFHHDAYTPRVRIWGIGQPEVSYKNIDIDHYLEGWFILKNNEIALVYASEHENLLYFRTDLHPPKQALLVADVLGNYDTNTTFSVLVGTDNPELLMNQIRQYGLAYQAEEDKSKH